MSVDLPEPEAASILSLDEVNFLELPPVEIGSNDHAAAGSKKYEIQTGGADLVQPQNDPPSGVVVMGEPEKPAIPEPFSDDDDRDIVSKSSAAAAIDVPSKAMVEAITQQVIETLSEKAIREIAWEVVPDLADLILKKMAEEKLKK